MAHQTPTHPHPEDMHATEGEGHHVGHVVPPRILIATGLGLLALTVITVLAAKIDFAQFDLHEMNIFVALTIAVIKASLVCLFFMHLRWDRPFNSFVLVVSLVLVGLFISFAMTDSTEYQHEVIRGEGQEIQTKLTKVEETLKEEAQAPPAEHH
jgi:cytochrome c oxidase subunit 4